jgi:hypothetical protein
MGAEKTHNLLNTGTRGIASRVQTSTRGIASRVQTSTGGDQLKSHYKERRTPANTKNHIFV